MVYGGKGSDRLVIQGGEGSDSFGINPEAVVLNGTVIRAISAERWTADGRAGADVFFINGGGLPLDLKGGAGNDRFQVSAIGAVSGLLDGGGDSDILDYALYHSRVTVNLQAATATATGGIARIEGFVGSNLFDTLIGTNAASTWSMNGSNTGTVNGVQFGSFESWIGGSGDDTFKLSNLRYLSGAIDGGLGTNTLNYASSTGGVTVDLSQGKATAVRGGIAHIANVVGGPGADMLTGDAGSNVLLGNAGNDVITGGPGGNDVLVGGDGRDRLTGNAGRNILIGGLAQDTLNGGGGDDILIGGTTGHDGNIQSLKALMAEWRRTDLGYQQRVDHLLGTYTGGLNSSSFLKSSTVQDDGVADLLSGLDGTDWFWGLASEVTDRLPGERLN
jgi:Ca2+-binding RTX toxin-like protein